MKEKIEEFKLHYVGQGLYKISYFETEAKKYGVQRGIPFTQLKNLSFGTPILLARYIPKSYKGNKIIKPQAEIFGYFTLDGISHNLTKPYTEELNKKLNIIKIDNNSKSVSRACGSYSIANTTYIKDNLEELKTKIEELFREHKEDYTFTNDKGETVCNCLKCNNQEVKEQKLHSDNILAYCLDEPCKCCTFINYKKINSHKWFINGRYFPLTSFILKPAKFSRGIQTVKIKDFSIKRQKKIQSCLIWVYNYRQRHYLPKAMKEKFKKDSNNSFKDVF